MIETAKTTNQRGKKSLAKLADIERIFDTETIRELARLAKLPEGSDLARFGATIRISARIFVESKSRRNSAGLRAEIDRLYKLDRAAESGKDLAAKRLARAIAGLADDVREWLVNSALVHRDIPTPQAILAADTRRAAVEQFRRVLSFGGGWVEGRARPGGKRSWEFQPLLRVPQGIQRGRPRSNADREFIQWLPVAYVEVTNRAPPRTAQFEKAFQGPFPKFVQRCFELLGAPTGNVTRLLNQYGAARRSPRPE